MFKLMFFSGQKKNFLIAGFLIGALALTIGVAQKPTQIRQNAAELSPQITDEEKKVAGIDINGKLDEERSEDIAKVNPAGYEQLLKLGIVEKPVETDRVIPLGGAGGGPTPIPLPTLTPPSVSSCGDISKTGNYLLTQDITIHNNTCINIHDTQDVTLDCQNHTITTVNNGSPLTITNVQNFSIKNCTIQAPPREISINIFNSNSGAVQNNTIVKGYVNSHNSNNIRIENNTFKDAVYQQNKSSNNSISNNTFKAAPSFISAGAIISNDGSNNTIKNNVADGSWDGIDHLGGSNEYTGADDGIIISNEANDIITENTINNNWDCGIETLGFIKDTQITNNKINNSGLCGIGAWYWNSWLNNNISGNVIDGAAYAFYIFRSFGLSENEQIVYFKDNTFTKNIFLHQRKNSYVGTTRNYSSWVNFQHLSPEIPLSAIQIGNNIFKNNDFDKTISAPVIMPATMIVDQGDNVCLPITDTYPRPLLCSNSVTPTPTPAINSATLLLSPTNPNPIPVNQEATIDIYLNSPDTKITGVSYTLITSNQNVIKIIGANPDTTVFNNTVKNDVLPESYTYTAVDTIGKPVSGKIKIGTVTVLAASSGTVDIRFTNVIITALNQIGSVGNIGIGATFTVKEEDTPSPTPTSIPTTCLPCDADLNKDGRVSGLDYSISVSCFKKPLDTIIRSGIMCSLADINKDNKIDDTDVDCIKTQFGKSCEIPSISPTSPPSPTPTSTPIQPTATPSGPVPGDATGDKIVDIRDYQIWRDEYLGIITTRRADFNTDGKVDFIDFSIFRNAFKPGID